MSLNPLPTSRPWPWLLALVVLAACRPAGQAPAPQSPPAVVSPAVPTRETPPAGLPTPAPTGPAVTGPAPTGPPPTEPVGPATARPGLASAALAIADVDALRQGYYLPATLELTARFADAPEALEVYARGLTPARARKVTTIALLRYAGA